MFGIFITSELRAVWWHRFYQGGAQGLENVIAVTKRYPIIVSSIILLSGILFNWKKRFKQNIWEAIYNGHAAVVRYHLKQKPKIVFDKNFDGDTPLHLAAVRDKPDIIKILLDHDACIIDFRSDIDYKIIKLKKGTALYRAVEHNSRKAVEYLLFRGAKPNIVNDYDEMANDGFLGSPLHLAVYKQNREIVKCLIDYDAQTDIKNILRKTPFDIAREIDKKNGNKEMEEFLSQQVVKRLALAN